MYYVDLLDYIKQIKIYNSFLTFTNFKLPIHHRYRAV